MHYIYYYGYDVIIGHIKHIFIERFAQVYNNNILYVTQIRHDGHFDDMSQLHYRKLIGHIKLK